MCASATFSPTTHVRTETPDVAEKPRDVLYDLKIFLNWFYKRVNFGVWEKVAGK